jgi:threonine synthase
MLALFNEYDYISDPHGAIGYAALEKYFKDQTNVVGVFLETAHPVKFLDVLPEAIKKAVIIPESILQIIKKEKKAERIFEYRELKTFLLK